MPCTNNRAFLDNNFQKCTSFKKFSPSEKQEITKAFDKLKNLIEIEESYGTPFEKIFNNGVIKYDIVDKEKGFYTFKSHGKDKTQIRILYRFVRLSNNNYRIELHKVFIKRKNNDKTYIKDFESFAKSFR